MEKCKIFIIDDHKLFVQSLSILLSEIDDFEVEGYAYSGSELINQLDILQSTVYLVDIELPDIGGDQLVELIKKKKEKVAVLVLTMYKDYKHVQNLIKAGADGYMLKAADMQELVNAIRTLAQGGKFFDKMISQLLFENIASGQFDATQMQIPQYDYSLTNREIEILSYVLADFTTTQIAQKLFISFRTVETHRKNILAKTGTKSNFGLMEYAKKHGIEKYSE
jgi:two-component system response regulator NreC